MDAKTENHLIRSVVTALFAIFCCALLGGSCWAFPKYRVWQRELAGKAELKEAEWNRKVAIEEAEAVKLSAVHLAAADVERAKGVAEANEIIGESLRENEAYLRWLWIKGLQDGSSEIIYVPTEAQLPILEAARLSERNPKKR